MAVAMFDLGEMWKRGEVFLPEVVASAEVFKRCNEIVEPALLAQRQEGDEADAIVVLATVKGDLHDLGEEHGRCDASHQRVRRARHRQGRERGPHRGGRRASCIPRSSGSRRC